MDLYKYYSCTRTELAKIKLPVEALQGEDIFVRRDIDLFYYSITNCLQGCLKQCIPKIKIHNVNSVAGWSEIVSHYYGISRIDLNFKWWVSRFLERVQKHTNSKSALFSCIDGVTGEADIADHVA